MNDDLNYLVGQLPECYQPIFGHPELVSSVSRTCEDRLAAMRPVVEALAAHYGRPVRLLDLGCAQGFFALSLSRYCEQVLGVDLLAENITLCNAIRDENGLSHVKFKQGNLIDVIKELEPGVFDVVLGLSVFHHVCHAQGEAAARHLIAELSKKVDVLLLELAVKEEPLYWADALPADPYQLVEEVPFLRIVGKFPTHLSNILRPMFYCSGRIWHFPESTEEFESWTNKSHEYVGEAHQQTRRYFFSPRSVAKVFRFVHDLKVINRKDLNDDLSFLSTHSKKIGQALKIPRIMEAYIGEDEGYLVMERMPGRRLSELVEKEVPYDEIKVIKDLLRQLVELEQEGLYHNDLRIWNVLVDEEGNSNLIDFGSITPVSRDVVWPFDIFASFLVFVAEVAAKKPPRVLLFRNPMLSPYWLPGRLRPWGEAIWSIAHAEWSFSLFLNLFDSISNMDNTIAQPSPPVHASNWFFWMGLNERLFSMATEVMPLQQMVSRAQEAEAKAQLAKAQVQMFLSSISWRVTAPLREAKLRVRQFRHMIESGCSTITSLTRRIARRVLLSALVHVLFRPERKAKVARLMTRFPTLDARLRAFSRDNRKYAIALSSKKGIARRVLLSALVHVLFRPERKAKVAGLMTRFPTLNARLRAFSRDNRNYAIALSSKKRSVAVAQSAAPLSGKSLLKGTYYHSSFSRPPIFPVKTGYRFIYYYVDHTVFCPVNTGMQRVTRRLGRALLEQGEWVRFVKWDAHHHHFILLNQTELTYLSEWNGPVLSPAVLENYPLPQAQPVFVSKHVPEEGHWLIVPEVTHITYHPHPVTLDVIMAAKRLGLKTAFIFYDAIPLRRPELAAMAPKHETYMQQLLLADLVVPISNWSARDLVSFFHTHEGANLTPTPKVASIALPGESHLAPRVTVPLSGGETAKLILSVGSVEQRKNQVVLVEAFERFCARYPDNDWQLTLIGNLHPDVAQKIRGAVKRNARIIFLENIPDKELDALYHSCAFTVFPSVEEGFGLPILESLWYGKPCICANFGAMAEVAEGGGCLTVNVREKEELVSAITRMTREPGLLERLAREAASRPMSTWADYAKSFIARIDHESDPIRQLGVIYYWVDHTCTYPANSGIQRVVRGLARALLEMGIKLVPAKWDEVGAQLYSPTGKELQHLARWNGPHPSEWSPWVDPSQSLVSNWILIPELTTYLAHPNLGDLKRYASAKRLRCAWIFYDAIPWNMRDIYQPEETLAHRRYMEGLNESERVLAISEHSRADLIGFLAASRMRTPNLHERVWACTLPGEFLEAPQVTEFKTESGSVTKILCVCTIEPRKNHLGLLEAFTKIIGQTKKSLELCLVGDSPFPELAEQVNHYINTVPGIHWERNIDDTRLRELYAECDFTVFPSLEEGFGLPILESLWNAKPCICRNSGAMAEVARGGGCLAVETADSTVLAQAILKLAEDDNLRIRLSRQATTRSFKTWRDYAHEVATCLATERHIPLLQQLPEPLGEADFYGQFVNIRPRPLMSICITTYNRAEWLALTLKNLAQLIPIPRREIEIVVCDNNSNDRTPNVVQPYLHRNDFRYYRNPQNVGMLGNLRVTAHHASGQYIWILGDDDLLKPGSIEQVLQVIHAHPGIALVYLNYSYTLQHDAKAVTKLDRFLNESIPIVTPDQNIVGPVHHISSKSENFFTAIYCLVFRRDHALRAYSQNTDGRPFSTMLTCIPTTYYVLNFMMNEPACWVGEPQVIVNMNVSWMKYAPLWILERLPEVYDLAERMGADPLAVDHWRINNLPSVLHFFKEIFENDQESNIDYFSAARLVNRMKHLNEFEGKVGILRDIYNAAHNHGRAGAALPPSQVFAAFQNQ